MREEIEQLREDWEEVVELRGEKVRLTRELDDCRKAYAEIRAALHAATRPSRRPPSA